MQISDRKSCLIKVLVSQGLGEPNSLAVDYYNYEVCWADGGRKELAIPPKIGECFSFFLPL
jgi:hypothetical protein